MFVMTRVTTNSPIDLKVYGDENQYTQGNGF